MVQWPLMIKPIYIHFNHCHSHMFITHEGQQKNQYEYENVKWYVRHTYGMNWKWQNWYNFHFYFNYHLKLYVFSIQNEFHWNRCSISVAPVASNMYFIQWIMTSYYQKGYKLYRNYSMWIKTACIQSCSQILFRFNWCCKIQLCCESTNVKLMWSHQLEN